MSKLKGELMNKVEEYAKELTEMLWYHVIVQLEDDPNKINITEFMDSESFEYFFYFKPPPISMREDIINLVKFMWEFELTKYNESLNYND